jgi:hypothetical protein
MDPRGVNLRRGPADQQSTAMLAEEICQWKMCKWKASGCHCEKMDVTAKKSRSTLYVLLSLKCDKMVNKFFIPPELYGLID